jgi:hypothetical protein
VNVLEHLREALEKAGARIEGAETAAERKAWRAARAGIDLALAQAGNANRTTQRRRLESRCLVCRKPIADHYPEEAEACQDRLHEELPA